MLNALTASYTVLLTDSCAGFTSCAWPRTHTAVPYTHTHPAAVLYRAIGAQSSCGAHIHSILLGSLGHLAAELIIANAAHVRGCMGNLQHPLGHTGGVLAGATSNVLDVRASSQLLHSMLRTHRSYPRPSWAAA